MKRMLGSPKRGVVVLTTAALAAIALLAVTSVVLASNQVRHAVNKRVQTTVAVSAVVIGQQTDSLVELVSSYASRPSLIDAVLAGSSGAAGIESTEAALAHAVPGISAAFVTDVHATSVSTYPPEPKVYGTNFAYREWFTGLVASGHAFVSSAIQTHEASHALAVTVTDYIRAKDGRPIGILGVNYSLQSLRAFAASVGRAQGITLTVTDRTGTSLTAAGGASLVSLAHDPRVRAALAGRSGLLDYSPVLAGGGHGAAELSAYAPIPGTGWAVIASVNKSAAFAGLVRLRDLVLGIAGLLVLLLLVTVRSVGRLDRRHRDAALELRSRDRALAKILESTHEAFFSTDAAGVITAWNAQAEKLYGWSAAEAIGRTLSETVVPAARIEGHLADLVRFRAGGGSGFIGTRAETTARHHDGHELPVEASSWPNDEGGGFSAFVHDISERVAIREEMEQARDDAMQASRLKGEFLANMSHEIRTPMNGVIGMSGLLLNTDLNPTQRDYAETVCASAEALLTVIDDILDFSKIEAGKLDVESVAFDLRTVVEQSAVLLAASAEDGALELTCRIDPELPAAVNGDPGRLRQVLLNLLGNAVKFTSVGEVNLTARLADSAGADTVMVELAVCDTGIGMSAATIEHLFEAFTQADTSTSRRYGGTGLGLAISKQLVELMGGSLSVESELGAGSTFTALIPFALALTTPRAPEVADLAGVRTLIVDDNLTNRRVLEEMVGAWGCTAVTAEGAEQAMVLLRRAVKEQNPFDVILVDLNMPDVDGYGLARAVCGEPELAHTPMVVLTSSAQRGEAEKTKKAGIVAYLTKPVIGSRLRIALDIALSSRDAVSTDAVSPVPSLELSGPVPSLELSGPNEQRSVVMHRTDREFQGTAQDGAAGFTGSSRGHVLIVEDHVVNQRVLAAMLASLGYAADVAVNGLEALAAIGRNHYAVVFMDCQMPVMDGYEATRQLREREPAGSHLCVIAITATAMAADRERCLAIGMDDYLVKPVSLTALSAVLARWVPPPRDGGNGGVGATPALDAQVVERLERLGEDAGEDLMAQLSTLFLADAEVQLVAMRLALADDDGPALVRGAHALTGASANIGASALAGLSAALEAGGATGKLSSSRAQLDGLEVELGRVRAALTSLALRP